VLLIIISFIIIIIKPEVALAEVVEFGLTFSSQDFGEQPKIIYVDKIMKNLWSI
jgi:hypothetical protein